MSHVAGKYTGLLRDGHAFAADAQDMAGATYTANLRRTQATGNLSDLSDGVMLSTALYLSADDVVTSLTFISGTTAANTPTNYWFALYSPDGDLLGQTADQESAAWAANTVKTLDLETAVTASEDGVYYAAVMVAATAAPTLVGAALHHASVSGLALGGGSVLVQTSGSSLTDTAPATIASPTTVAGVPLVIAT